MLPSDPVPPPGAALTMHSIPHSRDLSPSPEKGPGSEPVNLYLMRLNTPSSRRSTLSAIRVIARLLTDREDAQPHDVAWHELTNPEATWLRSHLIRTYAPATARRLMAALRGVMRACWSLELLSKEQLERIIDVGAVRGRSLPPGRALAPTELSALLDVCRRDPTPRGTRDAALLLLLVGGGLRRYEAAQLEVAGYDPVQALLLVMGKGGRARRVPLPAMTCAGMDRWLEVRGRGPGRMFWQVSRRGRILAGRGITGSAVWRIVSVRAKAAKLPSLAPHDLRRTYVTALLDSGADLAVTARLAGHSMISTTAGYDRRGDAAARHAVDKLLLPGPSHEGVS